MLNALSSDFFTTEPGSSLILSGAAASSRGAYEAGAGLVVTYPGSPVVEAFDVLADQAGPMAGRCHIVVNEHVAFHKALGYSLAGGRTLAIMKHVGFNVASDPAHYSGYTGIVGGMVILLGSDPGANCSTSEFDCRLYSLHTHLPVIEPGDFQEALDMTRGAFDLSESTGLPIIIVLPSRFCYGMGTVRTGRVKEPVGEMSFSRREELTNVGPRAVARHRLLIEKIERLANYDGKTSAADEINGIMPDRRLIRRAETLVVTSGIYFDMVVEALKVLNASADAAVFAPVLTYPMNMTSFFSAIEESSCGRVVFVEDLEGYLQLQASSAIARRGLSIEIRGKDIFPPWGALDFSLIIRGLAELLGRVELLPSGLDAKRKAVHREGTFCPGCPHRSFFFALNQVLGPDLVIGGDIGCSSLPPHFSDWLTCMNSGPSIAAGVSLALDGKGPRVVSCIGDSTLFHGGIQTIIECAQTDSDQICFILDNSWTAMTGHQPTPGTGRGLDGRVNESAVDIAALLRACGVKRVLKADPASIRQLGAVMNRLAGEKGFSCVVVARECRLQARRRPDDNPWKTRFAVVSQRCRACDRCYSVLTCPAIFKDDEGKPRIDDSLCVACGACRQVCPNGAIVQVKVKSREGGKE